MRIINNFGHRLVLHNDGKTPSNDDIDVTIYDTSHECSFPDISYLVINPDTFMLAKEADYLFKGLKMTIKPGFVWNGVTAYHDNSEAKVRASLPHDLLSYVLHPDEWHFALDVFEEALKHYECNALFTAIASSALKVIGGRCMTDVANYNDVLLSAYISQYVNFEVCDER